MREHCEDMQDWLWDGPADVIEAHLLVTAAPGGDQTGYERALDSRDSSDREERHWQ